MRWQTPPNKKKPPTNSAHPPPTTTRTAEANFALALNTTLAQHQHNTTQSPIDMCCSPHAPHHMLRRTRKNTQGGDFFRATQSESAQRERLSAVERYPEGSLCAVRPGLSCLCVCASSVSLSLPLPHSLSLSHTLSLSVCLSVRDGLQEGCNRGFRCGGNAPAGCWGGGCGGGWTRWPRQQPVCPGAVGQPPACADGVPGGGVARADRPLPPGGVGR